MKILFASIISIGLAVSGYSQTRSVLVNTSSAVVSPTNFWSADASNARTGLGLGSAATNPSSAFQPSSAVLSNLASSNGGDLTNLQSTNITGLIPFTSIFGSNTNPVLVDTNGEVVSPTNFWQAAPLTTTFIESQPTTNFTTNITAARFLHIHSLNTNIFNVTNTIALPTNGSTYNGDVALVVHQGPTNSMTRVRAVGSTNDIATMTRYNEAIEFVYYNNSWTFNHNQAFTEPIYFAGTNALGHAAESRTNLGLGNISTNGSGDLVIDTDLVVTNGQANFTNLQTEYLEFGINNGYLYVVGTNATPIVFEEPVGRTNFIHGLGLGPTNIVTFAKVDVGVDLELTDAAIYWDTTEKINFEEQKLLGGAWEVSEGSFNVFGETNKAITRTNLGLPLAALTNTSNANFRDAIELGATNNVSFSNVTASGTLTATGTVTATTNLVVNGFVDFSTNHTNVAPATNNQIQKFLQIRIGTNAYFLPLYQ